MNQIIKYNLVPKLIAFSRLSSQNLRHDLERKLHGDAKKLLVGLITEHGEFYAEALRTQIDGSFR